MGLQEHDSIMADEKISGKNVKKSIFPRLLDKTAWTGEWLLLKDSENAKTNYSFEKFRGSGTLMFTKSIMTVSINQQALL